MMPSLFISHGAPTLAIESNDYTDYLIRFAQNLPKPRAVVLFSAHWESRVQQISGLEQYSMIYDFAGFPEEMYRIVYPARGDAEITAEIQAMFLECGIPYQVDQRRGLDHGSWVVLRLLYPEADVPVIAMSVNPDLKPEEQYAIGKALATMREKDVLIIGSGGTVHNLPLLFAELRARKMPGGDWALPFENWLEERIDRWDTDALFDYVAQAPNALMAVPPNGKEHFVPLFYAMGAADNHRQSKLLHRSYQMGSLSLACWQFG